MQTILRYFYHPKTDRLVTSISSFAFALKHKTEVKHVVHGHSAIGQREALAWAANVLKSRLLSALWQYFLVMVGALFIAAVLWWLPLGLPIKWGWPAFLVLISLPMAIWVLSLISCARIFVLCRRLPVYRERIAKIIPVLDVPMACPTMLIAEERGERIKRGPAIIGLILLLIFTTTLGRMTVPLRGWVPIVHNLDGYTVAVEEVRWLKPSEFWEYAPRFIRGTAYGMLYYEEDMEKVLVLAVDYTLENTMHRSPTIVRTQMQTWVNNMAYYFAMNIKSMESVDLDREELFDEIREGIESEPVQAALNESIKGAAEQNLKEDFMSLEFDVRWVSIDDYVSKVR